MSSPTTITVPVNFTRAARGRRRLSAGVRLQPPAPPAGRVSRITRLMALAIRFEEQVRTGVLASYSQLAELGHVSRARVSQIVNLVNLAPDVQEALLFLPLTERGRDPLHLAQLQSLAQTLDWHQQRMLWRKLYPPRRPTRNCLRPPRKCRTASRRSCR